MIFIITINHHIFLIVMISMTVGECAATLAPAVLHSPLHLPPLSSLTIIIIIIVTIIVIVIVIVIIIAMIIFIIAVIITNTMINDH